jgi:fucose 4-O-acetylase-like acetyltransferase
VNEEQIAVPLPSSSAPSTESDRVLAARGFACLLVVAHHTISSMELSGLLGDNAVVYLWARDLVIHVRMPLFAFLSGFAYAYRPTGPGSGGTFLRKKLRRLGIPLLTATTIYYLGQTVTGSQPGLIGIWRAYLFQFLHLWFLQALLLVCVLLAVLEQLGVLSRIRPYLAVLAGAFLINLYGPEGDGSFFSAYDAVYLMPYFLVGVGVNRFRAIFLTPPALTTGLLIFVAAQGIHSLDVLVAAPDANARRTVIAILTGCSGALCILRWIPPVAVLRWIVRFSLSVYLYHSLSDYPGYLANLGMTWVPPSVFFAIRLAAATLFPIALEVAVGRFSVARLMFFGQAVPARSG